MHTFHWIKENWQFLLGFVLSATSIFVTFIKEIKTSAKLFATILFLTGMAGVIDSAFNSWSSQQENKSNKDSIARARFQDLKFQHTIDSLNRVNNSLLQINTALATESHSKLNEEYDTLSMLSEGNRKLAASLTNSVKLQRLNNQTSGQLLNFNYKLVREKANRDFLKLFYTIKEITSAQDSAEWKMNIIGNEQAKLEVIKSAVDKIIPLVYREYDNTFLARNSDLWKRWSYYTEAIEGILNDFEFYHEPTSVKELDLLHDAFKSRLGSFSSELFELRRKYDYYHQNIDSILTNQ